MAHSSNIILFAAQPDDSDSGTHPRQSSFGTDFVLLSLLLHQKMGFDGSGV